MTPARFEIGQKHKQESEAGSKASWNTPRSDSRPTMSYPSRMALAFALTSLMTVLVLVGVVSVVWGTVFTDYTRSNIVEIANSAAEKLATSYEENGNWTAGELRAVATSSLVSDDLGMQVVNKKGVIVYDDSWPSASATADVRENQATTDGTSGKKASHSPVSSAPTDSNSVANVEIVTSSGEHVGQVKLWAIGSDALLTKADSAFREKTFNAMALAAVVAVCISVVIGALMSRMLTKPIHRITSTAKQIRDGDLSARTGLRGDDEIDQLGETFDEMATSLEKDMKHEKRLTSDVAHELRTPLSLMQAQLELFSAEHPEVLPETADFLRLLREQTERMTQMTKTLLEMSELKTVPCTDRIELAPMVEEIFADLAPLADRNGIILESEGDGAMIGSDTLIYRMLFNLTENSIRYNRPNGTVRIMITDEKNRLVMRVADTGCGIPEKYRESIFQPFFRVDKSRSRENGGVGLGLSLVWEIVALHGGEIRVEESSEKGTTIAVKLPTDMKIQ